MSDPALTPEAIAALLSRYGKPRAIHYSGAELPSIVYADPGRHDFYYREEMPDSVAAYARVDLFIPALSTRLAEVKGERDALRAEVARLKGQSHD